MPRSDVTFDSAGTRCAAWRYEPEGERPPEGRPLVVMAHGFSAVREQRLDAYAERFAAAGLGALVFDYRGFGASGGEPRQLLDIRAQQADWRAAIAHARTLEGVDPDRIGLFGSSFSGGHVIALAAEDQMIAAVVAQCPFTDGLATLRAAGPASAVRLTLEGLRDQAAALAGRAPHYIPAAGPPGSSAFMTTPDAEPGMRSITPPGSTWENRVAARIALRVATYRPGLKAAQVRAPLHATVCDHDLLCPADRTVTLIARAPRGEVRRHPVGHFDVYTGETFERVVAEQGEFLARALTAR